MKIVVIGTRGCPNIQGGVETHCEFLYPRLVKMGQDVTIIRRSCYVTADNKIKEYEGVKLVDIYAPHSKSMEAIIHTFLAVFKAKFLHADIVHIHALGPNLMAPLARLLGMRVVMTNHGPDYDRQKWGQMAKFVIKMGERLGSHFANQVIVISKVIADIVARKYGRYDSNLIFNGVTKPEKSQNTDYIDSLGLEKGKYILALGRIVPEKGFDTLIDAFVRANLDGYKLVIAGRADHEDEYSAALEKQEKEAGVVLTGFIKGEKLNQIMTNARLFVLPSYHEGLPISLLEAMSYGIDVVVSDIPANKLQVLEADDFFHAGDIPGLAEKLRSKLSNPGSGPREYDLTLYNWDTIARQTLAVYEKARH